MLGRHDLGSTGEAAGLAWSNAGRRPESKEPPGRPAAEPRERYEYYPGVADVPEVGGVRINGRSYTIAVGVDIDSTVASGVLFAHGGVAGGHSLYVKDGRLRYTFSERYIDHEAEVRGRFMLDCGGTGGASLVEIHATRTEIAGRSARGH